MGAKKKKLKRNSINAEDNTDPKYLKPKHKLNG